MRFPWLGPTREEIEAVARDLIAHYGANASDEALRICEAYRRLGASKNEKLYRLAARRCGSRPKEPRKWRFGGDPSGPTVSEGATCRDVRLGHRGTVPMSSPSLVTGGAKARRPALSKVEPY